jgi:glycosyltransferase involved in cell wall biosynthesis
MTLIYNASILRGRWSGVEWAVWQRAVELASGKSPDEFVFLVAKGVTLPSPLPGGRIVRLPRFVGTRLGRIFHELFLMPHLVRYLLSPICDVGRGEESVSAAFFAPAYVAPPRLPCPFTLCLYDLHVFTHPQFCTLANRLHYRWRIPGSIRRAKTIEVPSEHVRDVLLERFPDAVGKTVVRHLALRDCYRHPVSDTEKTAVRDKYGLPSRYILFVGDPSPRKNLPAALAAWRALRADGEDIGFVIAGTAITKPMSNLRFQEPPVTALGYVPDEDMPALYAGAAVLLYPSFDEGYGLPIVEAKACGCPVVTSSPTASEIAPDAFICGTDEAAITAALRAVLHGGNA